MCTWTMKFIKGEKIYELSAFKKIYEFFFMSIILLLQGKFKYFTKFLVKNLNFLNIFKEKI